MSLSCRIASSHLRVDVGGTPAIDGLTFTSTGDHVLVLGAARALFEAASGLRTIARGDLRVEGVAVMEAIRAGAAAFAPLDPPLPGSWTVLQYVVWSARLAGHDRTPAMALANESLVRMQIRSMYQTRLVAAPPPVRRAVVLAATLATGAKTILVEDPVLGLDDESAQLLARATAHAFDDRHTVLFAARLPLQSPLAFIADEAIVIAGSEVVAQGAPAEIAASERTFAVRVHGDLDTFARAVEAHGGRARAVAAPGAQAPMYTRVDLGPLAARDLVRIAAESDAVVLELRPLARPFA